MPTQIDVPATFTLTGDYENRVLEALKVAQHQVRLAQGGAAPRMQDALVGLEEAPVPDPRHGGLNASHPSPDDRGQNRWSDRTAGIIPSEVENAVAIRAETTLALTDAPHDDELAVIAAGLRAYNEAQADTRTVVHSPSSSAIPKPKGRRWPARPHVTGPLAGRAVFSAGGFAGAAGLAGSDTIARPSATEDVDCGEGRADCADRSAFRLHVRVMLPVRH
jgi:hypothetical protein